MVTMTTLLISAAEFSNMFSIAAILLCFCAMVLFITRLVLNYYYRLYQEKVAIERIILQISDRGKFQFSWLFLYTVFFFYVIHEKNIQFVTNLFGSRSKLTKKIGNFVFI